LISGVLGLVLKRDTIFT